MCVCVCECVWEAGGGGGRGLFYVVVFNAMFSNSELNTKSFSCQTSRNWKNNISHANIFISHTKGKPVYQKTHTTAAKLEMSVSFVILS